MTSDDWTRVDNILADALTLPSGQRGAFVREACGTDAGLRDRLERLIAAAEAADARFGTSWGAGDRISDEAILDALDPPLDPDQRIGPFEVIRRIGRGGMGSVYLVRRADGQYERDVALKVVGAAMLREELLARFLRERQILARLQHPAIARLYTGGFTEDGRPYFAMEYVDGTPITEFCDSERMSVPDRLRLFRRVGEAVQYAHRNLVIHRDLKPSNILVTAAGDVKLLDFGIAKLLVEERNPASTQTGLPVMTPAYASPEQVLGHAVTTASDTYQLALLLYELLAGTKPHGSERSSSFEIERAIVEEDPVAPSLTAAARDGRDGTGPVAEIARARSSTPVALARTLRGDLDTIILRGLEKDPDRRYGSVSTLLADIDRYLEGLPVAARPATVGYRIGKFVRRHRLGAAMTSVFVAMLAAYVVTVTVQAGRIRDERNRAEAERDRALREQAKAEQVASVLTELFESADPYTDAAERGADVRVSDVLDLGTARVREELASEPDVQASLLNVLGTVYRHLGEYGEAESLYRSELEIRAGLGDGRDLETADAMADLGYLLQDSGEVEESERLLREALAIQRSMLDDKDPALALTLTRLGGLLWFNKGDYVAADSAFREALEIRRESLDRTSEELTSSLNSMANLLHSQGDYAGAEPLYREAIELYREQLGDHPNVAVVQSNFAALLRDKGDYDEAESVTREALAAHRRLQGDRNIDVALGLGTLGSILIEKGRTEEAQRVLDESLAMQREFYEAEHPYILRTRLYIAHVGFLEGRLTETRTSLEDLEAAYRRSLPPDHFAQGDPPALLGRVLLAQGTAGEAVDAARRALAIRERAYPPSHWRVAEARALVGIALAESGSYARARPLLEDAVRLLEAQRGLGDGYTREAIAALAGLYEASGETDRAREHRARLAATASGS